MKSSDIRAKYLQFFQSRGHAVIPAAPIVPLEDPTTLFTSSGMQPLVPYLKGETHPMGLRLTDSQPSFRAEDIEEIGDNRHICMFEMLGNWSLGDYFKKEQLPWFFEFVTREVGLDPSRLYVTVFAGDESAARDDEAIEIWQKVFGTTTPAQSGVDGFDPAVKIYLYPAKKNWWSRAGVPANMPPGEIGGPDSEMFYDFGAELGLHENSPWKDEPCHVNCDCGRFMEIGNSVFMQFEKMADGSFRPLPKQNVDFGGGLERIAAASNHDPDVFHIDMFAPIIKAIETSSGKSYKGNEAPMRVIADHLRAAAFMMAEGLEPSNKMQGYILRRLLRRAAVKARELGGDAEVIFRESIPTIIAEYAGAGFVDPAKEAHVQEVAKAELVKFGRALDRGLREMEKVAPADLTATFAFNLFQSYGFPFEVSQELARQKGIELDKVEFDQVFAAHKADSRTASAGMFKGGLADHSEVTTKLHTATHLLHKALRTVLGTEVHQAGSNITPERLRFDYTYAGKPTPEQIMHIETMINEAIRADYPVTRRIEDKKAAIDSGAMAFFAEKYPEKVSVYIIGTDPDKEWFSKELCGGPHVEHTGVIGSVKIIKDESLGSGTRRIYAKLEA
jgi:alanyl-tRNA synthetase